MSILLECSLKLFSILNLDGDRVTSLILLKAEFNPLTTNPRHAQGETQLNRKACATSCQFNQSLMGTVSQAAELLRCNNPLSAPHREICGTRCLARLCVRTDGLE